MKDLFLRVLSIASCRGAYDRFLMRCKEVLLLFSEAIFQVPSPMKKPIESSIANATQYMFSPFSNGISSISVKRQTKTTKDYILKPSKNRQKSSKKN